MLQRRTLLKLHRSRVTVTNALFCFGHYHEAKIPGNLSEKDTWNRSIQECFSLPFAGSISLNPPTHWDCDVPGGNRADIWLAGNFYMYPFFAPTGTKFNFSWPQLAKLGSVPQVVALDQTHPTCRSVTGPSCAEIKDLRCMQNWIIVTRIFPVKKPRRVSQRNIIPELTARWRGCSAKAPQQNLTIWFTHSQDTNLVSLLDPPLPFGNFEPYEFLIRDQYPGH